MGKIEPFFKNLQFFLFFLIQFQLLLESVKMSFSMILYGIALQDQTIMQSIDTAVQAVYDLKHRQGVIIQETQSKSSKVQGAFLYLLQRSIGQGSLIGHCGGLIVQSLHKVIFIWWGSRLKQKLQKQKFTIGCTTQITTPIGIHCKIFVFEMPLCRL